MNDTDLLDRLRSDLDAFAGEPGEPPTLHDVAPTVRRSRPTWVPVAAAAATVAIVVAGLVAITRRDEPDTGEVPPPAGDTMPVPPIPDGWTVVEWGDIRLSLPPELDPFRNGCTPTAGDEMTIEITCGSRTIVISEGANFDPTASSVVRNGVATQLAPVPDLPGATQLHLAEPTGLVRFIGVTDDDIGAIASTVGVSSRWRTRLEAPPPVQEGWDSFTYDTVTLRLPGGWATTPEADGFCLAPVGTACAVSTPLSPPRNFVHISRADLPDPGMLPVAEQTVVGSDGREIHVQVGLGVDGTIGRTILGSFSAPTVPTPSTAPEAAESGLPVPPTPGGWAVVEWGDVRFSLPRELDPYGDECDARDEQGILTLTCGGRVVTVIPAVGASDPTAPGAITVNGLTALRTEIRCPEGCRAGIRDSVEYLLVDLATLVRFTGFDPAGIDAIAKTIGVSSSWRARNESARPVPDDWATFAGDGFTFRYPPAWPSIELFASDRDPDFCRVAPTVAEAVTIGRGDIGQTADCDVTLAPPTDGVRVFQLDGALLPSDDGPTRTLVVSGGGGEEWVIRVGFGVDGTVGRAILATITSTVAPPPPTTAPPPDTTVYETAMTVVQDGDEPPQLCVFGVDESYPPQCAGVELVGFDWAQVAPEGSEPGTTWGPAYIRGTYDQAADTFTVIEARTPTEADAARIGAAMQTRRDRSIPCPPPDGGWPPPPDEWPDERLYDVGVFSWYLDATESVLVVPTTGDAVEREAAIRTIYDGPLCVASVAPRRDDLDAIATTLWQMSSVQFLDVSITIDPTDAWVAGLLVAPNPQLQASLDAEYGEGVVRLTSLLVPVAPG